jgi:hypothetical protein
MSSSTVRVYPPGGAATSTTINSPVNGIVGYTAGSNGAVDAQLAGDADSLIAAGWVKPESLIGSGTTALRPPASGKDNKFKFYYDTTIPAFIWSDGTIWRNGAGAAA